MPHFFPGSPERARAEAAIAAKKAQEEPKFYNMLHKVSPLPRLPQKRVDGLSRGQGKRERTLTWEKGQERQGQSVSRMIARRQSASALLEEYMDDETGINLASPGVTKSAMPAKVSEEPGFILHSWEWSESSQLLDVLTLHYGRVFLVARGAKRPSSQMRGLLTGFCPLLFSWSGKHEAKNLTKVEWVGTLMPLTGETLMSGFYVNELVIKLCEREELHPGLFADYVAVIDVLAGGEKETIQPALRDFEKRILTLAGWGPGTEGYPEHERYAVLDGVIVGLDARRDPLPETTYSRAAVADLLDGNYTRKETQRALRDMLRELIQCHLGNRTINTRRILSELHQFSRG